MAQDFFSLRKLFAGKTRKFTEGRNLLNPASHGDIAWAGALASRAAETGGTPVAFAGFGRTTPNFGRAFGVGTLKANSCPLQALCRKSRSDFTMVAMDFSPWNRAPKHPASCSDA